MRLAAVRLTAHLRSLNLTAAACLRRTSLRARAFKAATSRRSLANSEHDLTFGAGTEGLQQEQRGLTPWQKCAAWCFIRVKPSLPTKSVRCSRTRNRSVDDQIVELLYRNLQEVFGEGGAARRRAAIEDFYTERINSDPPQRCL
jgi:hypothetical protein